MAEWRYSHVHLNSADMPKAVEFYKRMFGARVVGESPWHGGRITTSLDINGMRVLISNKLYPLESTPLSEIPEPHLGLEHFGLETDDLDAAARDLRAKGAEFIMEPHEFRPGQWIAFIRAPDGVRIELTEPKLRKTIPTESRQGA